MENIQQIEKNDSLKIETPIVSSLPSAVETFKRAWGIYKQRLCTFLEIMIIPISIISALVFLMDAIAEGKLSKFISDPLVIFSITSFFMIVVFVIQSLGQIALLYAIKNDQKEDGVIKIYKRAWSKMLSYWWICLLSGFIILGGFLLFVVPGIIFSIWFAFPIFILIADDLKGMDALLKSKEYVKGRWMNAFCYFFFIGAVLLIAMLILSGILFFLKNVLIQWFGQFIFELFLTPLLTIYLFSVFNNFKQLKGDFIFTPAKKEKITFICMAILGILMVPILATLIVFSLNHARIEARNAMRETNVIQIQTNLYMYYNKYNKYPISLDALSSELSLSLPTDPLTRQPYQYKLQADEMDYQLCAQLEPKKNQKCISSEEMNY
ncbi:MAG: hypothetical protein AAB526_01670 [Patescibacteria group bacterium]